MHLADWIIMLVPLLFVAGIGIYTRQYVRSVADFMAGGRNAGRYLLCTARSGMGGAVSFVAGYQVFMKSGFVLSWWGQIGGIVMLFVTLFAFVTYRYRQTRALTLAQFFEMRYSRRFRLFCGGLGFLAGIVNYGVIPVIGARFFVYFLQLPPAVQIFSHQIDTALPLMGLFLTLSTLLVTLGGQITVLAVDCVEGMFNLLATLVIAVVLMWLFNSNEALEVLTHNLPGKSLVNPFDAYQVEDFNLSYTMIGLVVGVYWTMSWQNAHAFNSCGLTPHETRMGGILGRYRGFIGTASGALLSLALLTYLYHPNHAAGAGAVRELISRIPDKQYQSQMLGPVALTHILPIGIRGLLCATLLMGVFSTDGMHLHSWSSILVQDVILPLRKRPLSVQHHLLLLRLGMVLVAVFAFIFGALFRQSEYVQMWFGVSQALFCGGAGAAIIGGLYWRKGTTQGAWTGMIVGVLLSVGLLILRQPFWNEMHASFAVHHLGQNFPLNGTYISFVSSFAALAFYVMVSLATCREPHDMNRLLHRGQYADPDDKVVVTQPVKPLRRFDPVRIAGITKEFSRSDRVLTLATFWYQLLWFGLFIIGTAVEFVHPFSAGTWANFWLWSTIYFPLVVGIVTTIWFTIGCTKDMQIFFQRLRRESVDPQDDGTVENENYDTGHHVVVVEHQGHEEVELTTSH